ncbi:MAG: Nif11-like leader peptide family natural product precursor [Eggerthellaceae bacterium]|nr:Nif11-like leader peptide family natural product precursor [Eggerthellaceae bacterium]
MNFNDLTPEQKERVRNVKTPEDLLKLAKEEGYELSDAEIEDISGGKAWDLSCSVCTGYRGCKVY